jgi:hypothetical protein
MKCSNQSLHENLVNLAAREREITLQVLRHLREAEARKLYAERGHSSLFEYAVQELKYSEGSAQRRISAMRLLTELPDLEARVESGEIKVTQLSQVQTFLRTEAKAGKRYSAEEKRERVLGTIGKSTREVAFELNPNQNESIMIDPATFQALKEVRDRFAHELPHSASLSDVVGFLAEKALKNDPMKKPNQEKNLVKPSDVINSPPAPALAVKRTRFIPVSIKREVWRKSPEGCAYVSPITLKRCGSRHRLQIDHIRPYSLGGSSSDSKNLELLCAVHNRIAWWNIRKGGAPRESEPEAPEGSR